MTAANWFWIIYVVCGVFGTWRTLGNRTALGVGLVVYILIGLIGWHVFGPPLR